MNWRGTCLIFMCVFAWLALLMALIAAFAVYSIFITPWPYWLLLAIGAPLPVGCVALMVAGFLDARAEFHKA